jgi:hypothetical protein
MNFRGGGILRSGKAQSLKNELPAFRKEIADSLHASAREIEMALFAGNQSPAI